MKLFTCADFDCKEADFVICGVPFDKNHSYREGSADAPDAIREASWELETYLLEKDIDILDLNICDIGDIETENFSELFIYAEKIIKKFKIETENKRLIMLGGDHSITFPFVSAINRVEEICVLSLDAHFDLRERYQGSENSNACVMRRVAEEIGCENLYEIGTRAAYKDDFLYAKNNNINFIPYHEIRDNGIDVVDKLIEKINKNNKKLYLSCDMDVIDSALAPGVENPEAEGLSVQELLEIIRRIFRNCDVAACDIVEVAPGYDNKNNKITPMIAARVIFEILGEWNNK